MSDSVHSVREFLNYTEADVVFSLLVKILELSKPDVERQAVNQSVGEEQLLYLRPTPREYASPAERLDQTA